MEKEREVTEVGANGWCRINELRMIGVLWLAGIFM